MAAEPKLLSDADLKRYSDIAQNWAWGHASSVASALLSHIAALTPQLEEIKAETVEYVLDGADFNWVEAVIAIRAWREQAAQLDAAQEELKLWKPLSQEEAERALDEAKGIPISDDEISRITAKVTDPTFRPTEPEHVLMAAKIKQLQEQLDAARQESERAKGELESVKKKLSIWARADSAVDVADKAANIICDLEDAVLEHRKQLAALSAPGECRPSREELGRELLTKVAGNLFAEWEHQPQQARNHWCTVADDLYSKGYADALSQHRQQVAECLCDWCAPEGKSHYSVFHCKVAKAMKEVVGEDRNEQHARGVSRRYQDTIAELRQQVAELEGRLREAEREKGALETSHKQLEGLHEQVKSELAQLRQRLEEAERERDEARKWNAEYKRRADIAREDKEKHEERHAYITAEKILADHFSRDDWPRWRDFVGDRMGNTANDWIKRTPIILEPHIQRTLEELAGGVSGYDTDRDRLAAELAQLRQRAEGAERERDIKAADLSEWMGLAERLSETVQAVCKQPSDRDRLAAELAAAKEQLAIAKEAGLSIGTLKEAGKEPRLTWDIVEGSPLDNEIGNVADLVAKNAELEKQLAAREGELERVKELVGWVRMKIPEWGVDFNGVLDELKKLSPGSYRASARLDDMWSVYDRLDLDSYASPPAPATQPDSPPAFVCPKCGGTKHTKARCTGGPEVYCCTHKGLLSCSWSGTWSEVAAAKGGEGT